MKYVITAALALSLTGAAALAQDRDHDRGGGEHRDSHEGGQRAPGPQGPPPGQRFGSAPGGGGHAGGPGPQPQPGQRGGAAPSGPGRGQDRHDGGYRGPEGARGDGDRLRGPEPGFRQGGFLRDHGWRGGQFHGPVFRYPPGWGYRTWAFGAFLPGVFIASDYTLWQYWVYGLPAPPPGYHWIRVGPDALLVRYGDGYILDAAYGIFY